MNKTSSTATSGTARKAVWVKPELTQELISELARLRSIDPRGKICGAVLGIPLGILKGWLTRGRALSKQQQLGHQEDFTESDWLHIELICSYRRARATAKMKDMQVILRAAEKGVVKAAAWRRHLDSQLQWKRKENALRKDIESLVKRNEQLMVSFEDHAELVAENHRLKEEITRCQAENESIRAQLYRKCG